MKNIILLILISFSGVSQNKPDLENGFDVYTFGNSPNEYKDLALEIDEGNTKLYSLPKCSLMIKGVQFQNVSITFIKNRLSSISLQSKNSSGIKLLQALKETYGEPGKSNPSKESYEWFSAKVELLYEKHPSSKDATISFSSKEIYAVTKK